MEQAIGPDAGPFTVAVYQTPGEPCGWLLQYAVFRAAAPDAGADGGNADGGNADGGNTDAGRDAGAFPTAVIQPGTQVIHAGAVAELDGSGSRAADGGPVALYTWTQVAGPTGVCAPGVCDASTPLLSVAPPLAGTYAFELVVQDSAGLVSPPAQAVVGVTPAGCGCSGASASAAWGALLLAVRAIGRRRGHR
jgi:hypothetical protein